MKKEKGKTHHSSLTHPAKLGRSGVTHHFKVKNGFTLVELMLYMSLLAIFIITLTDIFVSLVDIQLESSATSSVEQDGRSIMGRFNYDIPRAGSIILPANLGESSNSLVIDIGGTTYTYSLVSYNLQLDNGTTTNNLNGSETKISGISFARIGNLGGRDTIKIRFTTESVTQRDAGLEVRTFNTTVGRR